MGIFKITHKSQNSMARTGVVSLPHGDVQTPVFMPVGTKATVKGVYFSQIEELGYNLILNNTYHVFLNIGTQILKNNFGSDIRNFATGWDKNILTDSGGFQIFSFSENDKNSVKITDDGVTFTAQGGKQYFSPSLCVQIQRIINSDIQMALDICSPPGIDKKLALKYKNITTDWCKKAKVQWEIERSEGYLGNLFGIFQGNFFKDLRYDSLHEILDLDLPGYAIGGLSVGETKEEFAEFLAYTSSILKDDFGDNFEKPLYVMGIGTPDYIFECVQNGVDMFDCVLPTRMARNGNFMTKFGRVNLSNAVFKDMNKTIADVEIYGKHVSYPNSPLAKYPLGYLYHLVKQNEMLGGMLLSLHNLYFLKDLVDQIRLSIVEDRFEDFKKEYMSTYRNTIKEK